MMATFSLFYKKAVNYSCFRNGLHRKEKTTHNMNELLYKGKLWDNSGRASFSYISSATLLMANVSLTVSKPQIVFLKCYLLLLLFYILNGLLP